jgi:hypothetical protein
MIRCIIKNMVVKTQEAKDALESYIKDFDITKFPSKNVPSACLWLKAVAKALGNKDLPSNVIHKVLEGFAKSLTKAFNDVCSSQIAMRCARRKFLQGSDEEYLSADSTRRCPK